MMNVMPITQVWISTPVDYLVVDEARRSSLVDALLAIDGVAEVCHYSDIVILCDLKSDSDTEALMELTAMRSKVQCVFESFHVWPNHLPSIHPQMVEVNHAELDE